MIDRTQRPAATGAALVDADDAKACRVEHTAKQRRGARARSAMDHDGGDTVVAAKLLHLQHMAAADRQRMAAQRGRGGVQARSGHRAMVGAAQIAFS